MTEQMRNDLTPQGYIRHMLAETENGSFTVTYKNSGSSAVEEKIFKLSWTTEDAEEIEEKYNLLTSALTRIGRIHDQLDDEANRKKLLSQSDLEIWDRYVRRFDPMEVNWSEFDSITPCEPQELMSLIFCIREHSNHGETSDEEERLLQQFDEWEEEQSQKRIPFNRCSGANILKRAMRYEKFIHMGAPEIVVTEEGRCLAEEMVLYYFGKEEPIVVED